MYLTQSFSPKYLDVARGRRDQGGNRAAKIASDNLLAEAILGAAITTADVLAVRRRAQGASLPELMRYPDLCSNGKDASLLPRWESGSCSPLVFLVVLQVYCLCHKSIKIVDVDSHLFLIRSLIASNPLM